MIPLSHPPGCPPLVHGIHETKQSSAFETKKFRNAPMTHGHTRPGTKPEEEGNSYDPSATAVTPAAGSGPPEVYSVIRARNRKAGARRRFLRLLQVSPCCEHSTGFASHISAAAGRRIHDETKCGKNNREGRTRLKHDLRPHTRRRIKTCTGTKAQPARVLGSGQEEGSSCCTPILIYSLMHIPNESWEVPEAGGQRTEKTYFPGRYF